MSLGAINTRFQRTVQQPESGGGGLGGIFGAIAGAAAVIATGGLGAAAGGITLSSLGSAVGLTGGASSLGGLVGGVVKGEQKGQVIEGEPGIALRQSENSPIARRMQPAQEQAAAPSSVLQESIQAAKRLPEVQQAEVVPVLAEAYMKSLKRAPGAGGLA
jgi:hypothetical protein